MSDVWQPVFSKLGGFTVGRNYWFAWRASWPSARLKIYDDSIVLSMLFFDRFDIPKSEIRRLSEYKTPLSSGLRIEHSVGEYPRFIVFWTPHIEEAAHHLHANGFPYDNTRI